MALPHGILHSRRRKTISESPLTLLQTQPVIRMNFNESFWKNIKFSLKSAVAGSVTFTRNGTSTLPEGCSAHIDEAYLLKRFEEHATKKESPKKKTLSDEYHNEAKPPAIQHPNSLQEEPIAIQFIKSDLRLVIDLQNCVKAQQNSVYANKVKLSNHLSTNSFVNQNTKDGSGRST